jgi:protein gp37
MGKGTKIEWAHHTFNPWWGCTKVSDGCKNCYAETFSKRTGHAIWGDNAERRFFGDKHWNEPLRWNADAKTVGEQHRVFCASMADVFENRRDLEEPRRRLFKLIDATPNLIWLLLTKRPENIVRMTANWTLPTNVWLGTSAEDQKWWSTRVPILMRIPAAAHFVSVEPLVGEIYDMLEDALPDWIIVGGESGPKARPMPADWVRSIRDQIAGRKAFFFKQWGGRDKKAAGRLLDGKEWNEVPKP